MTTKFKQLIQQEEDNSSSPLQEIEQSKGDEVLTSILGALKGPKGDKGDEGKPGRTPVKHEDYMTPEDITEMVKMVIPRATPKKGKDYVDGINGKPGIQGPKGDDGKPGAPGKNGSPDTPNQVVKKINEATTKISADQIDKDILNIEDILKGLRNKMKVSDLNGHQQLLYGRKGEASVSASGVGTTVKTITNVTTLIPIVGNRFNSTHITALANALTIGIPSGTLQDGDNLVMRFFGAGSQTLTFNAMYNFSTDLAAPAATTAGKTLYLGFRFNAFTNKLDCLAKLDNL